MNDPYKILDVSPNASDDDIKQAYRKLIKKYHPDNYMNNPLADLALEKTQELNEAYDTIVKNRKNGASGNSSYSQNSYSQNSSSSNPQFADIRRMIQMGRFLDAEDKLNGISTSMRGAEWHFLIGNIYYQRGWLQESVTHFRTACDLEPNNNEYSYTLNHITNKQNGNYANNPYNTMSAAPGACACGNCCANLMCLNCLSECCCGCN